MTNKTIRRDEIMLIKACYAEVQIQHLQKSYLLMIFLDNYVKFVCEIEIV